MCSSSVSFVCASGAAASSSARLVVVDIPAGAEVVQPGLSHAKGYSDFGGDRKEWARRVALDMLIAGQHQFAQHELLAPGQGVRCTRCLADFPASKIPSLSKGDPGCPGVLLAVGPSPLLGPQTWVSLRAGEGFTVKGVAMHSSHSLRHFSGAIWCHECGGTLNLLSSSCRGGAPLLKNECKKAPANKMYRLGLVQIAAGLTAPSHLTGRWPGPSNLRLAGFV